MKSFKLYRSKEVDDNEQISTDSILLVILLMLVFFLIDFSVYMIVINPTLGR